MKIKEFIEGRNISYQTIQKYILRHPEEFEGHATRTGKSIDLDNIAVSILDKEYPRPYPVTVGIDPEEYTRLQADLIKVQQEHLQLLNRYLTLSESVAALKAELQVAAIEQKSTSEHLKNEMERLQTENDRLTAELKKSHSEGLFRRIIKRTK